MTNTRPRSRDKPSRRERRTVAPSRVTQPREAVKVYSTPTSAAPAATAPRRTYLAEPTPVDYSSEYRYIRHDLKRIFIWSGLLLLAMFALWLLPVL